MQLHVTHYIEIETEMSTVCSKLYSPNYIVQQGSILEPLLFNIFKNDLFYFIQDAQLLNFADDNTIATLSNSVQMTTQLQPFQTVLIT